MEGDVLGSMFIKVAAHYSEGFICGEYIALSDQDVSIPDQIPFKLKMKFADNLEFQIDT